MEISPEQEDKFRGLVMEAPKPLSIETFDDNNEAIDFVNHCLNGSYTDEGIDRWWNRRRSQLDNKTPAEVWLHNPEKVMNLAISSLT